MPGQLLPDEDPAAASAAGLAGFYHPANVPVSVHIFLLSTSPKQDEINVGQLVSFKLQNRQKALDHPVNYTLVSESTGPYSSKSSRPAPTASFAFPSLTASWAQKHALLVPNVMIYIFRITMTDHKPRIEFHQENHAAYTEFSQRLARYNTRFIILFLIPRDPKIEKSALSKCVDKFKCDFAASDRDTLLTVPFDLVHLDDIDSYLCAIERDIISQARSSLDAKIKRMAFKRPLATPSLSAAGNHSAADFNISKNTKDGFAALNNAKTGFFYEQMNNHDHAKTAYLLAYAKLFKIFASCTQQDPLLLLQIRDLASIVSFRLCRILLAMNDQLAAMKQYNEFTAAFSLLNAHHDDESASRLMSVHYLWASWQAQTFSVLLQRCIDAGSATKDTSHHPGFYALQTANLAKQALRAFVLLFNSESASLIVSAIKPYIKIQQAYSQAMDFHRPMFSHASAPLKRHSTSHISKDTFSSPENEFFHWPPPFSTEPLHAFFARSNLSHSTENSNALRPDMSSENILESLHQIIVDAFKVAQLAFVKTNSTSLLRFLSASAAEYFFSVGNYENALHLALPLLDQHQKQNWASSSVFLFLQAIYASLQVQAYDVFVQLSLEFLSFVCSSNGKRPSSSFKLFLKPHANTVHTVLVQLLSESSTFLFPYKYLGTPPYIVENATFKNPFLQDQDLKQDHALQGQDGHDSCCPIDFPLIYTADPKLCEYGFTVCGFLLVPENASGFLRLTISVQSQLPLSIRLSQISVTLCYLSDASSATDSLNATVNINDPSLPAANFSKSTDFDLFTFSAQDRIHTKLELPYQKDHRTSDAKTKFIDFNNVELLFHPFEVKEISFQLSRSLYQTAKSVFIEQVLLSLNSSPVTFKTFSKNNQVLKKTDRVQIKYTHELYADRSPLFKQKKKNLIMNSWRLSFAKQDYPVHLYLAPINYNLAKDAVKRDHKYCVDSTSDGSSPIVPISLGEETQFGLYVLNLSASNLSNCQLEFSVRGISDISASSSDLGSENQCIDKTSLSTLELLDSNRIVPLSEIVYPANVKIDFSSPIEKEAPTMVPFRLKKFESISIIGLALTLHFNVDIADFNSQSNKLAYGDQLRLNSISKTYMLKVLDPFKIIVEMFDDALNPLYNLKSLPINKLILMKVNITNVIPVHYIMEAAKFTLTGPLIQQQHFDYEPVSLAQDASFSFICPFICPSGHDPEINSCIDIESIGSLSATSQRSYEAAKSKNLALEIESHAECGGAELWAPLSNELTINLPAMRFVGSALSVSLQFPKEIRSEEMFVLECTVQNNRADGSTSVLIELDITQSFIMSGPVRKVLDLKPSETISCEFMLLPVTVGCLSLPTLTYTHTHNNSDDQIRTSLAPNTVFVLN